MSDIKKDHPRLQDPNHVHHPYWKHAHRDWRVWVGATLMLAIMLLYVWRGALGWPPPIQTQQLHVVPAPEGGDRK